MLIVFLYAAREEKGFSGKKELRVPSFPLFPQEAKPLGEALNPIIRGYNCLAASIRTNLKENDAAILCN